MKSTPLTLLAELGRDGVEPGRALIALAWASPSDCLEYLAGVDEETLRSFPTGVVARALDTALETSPKVHPLSADLAATIARRYRDTLSSSAVAKILGIAGAAPPAAVVDALEADLRRSPRDPQLLRCAIKLTQAAGDLARTDELLTRLGLADNSVATVSFVHRSRAQMPGAEGSRVRIALLSSYTVDHAVPFVDLECRAAGLAPAIYVSPFNSWMRDVLDETSGLREFAPDIAFLSVSIDDLIPQLAEPVEVAELGEAGASALQRVVAVAEAYVRWATGKPLVVHAFHSSFSAGPLGIIDGRGGISRREWLAELNLRLAAALRKLPDCYLLDLESVALDNGVNLGENPKMRHLAGMRLPPTALGPLARSYVRYVCALKALTKKCVVVDLDNTLWGGIVGEDGKDGVRLGHASPGSEYVEFQEFLASLARRGILLAVNSKNNPDDALEVIRTHEAMVLRETAFSAMRINWQPKHENMIALAAELNIGLDSMVFVDDNPDERELMRQMLPQVLTIDLPRDPALYRAALEAIPQLEILSLTAEDRQRREQYQTARLRDEARVSAASVEDYLRSLGIRVEIGPVDRPAYARVTQLFARTNQFNATTRRYDASEVERFANDPDWRLVALKSADRFGEQGLVAVALVKTSGSSWEIDSFLMSCRVIGYGIETALLSYIVQNAAAAGATAVTGSFIPTKKNAPAKELFSKHGFVARGAAEDAERWEHPVEPGIPFPAWIERAQS